eukprot:m.218331 g.218331  ORF g.218331 m.218331 type:complete len:219 (-) comp29607_c0_seq1:520-1176(-)
MRECPCRKAISCMRTHRHGSVPPCIQAIPSSFSTLHGFPRPKSAMGACYVFLFSCLHVAPRRFAVRNDVEAALVHRVCVELLARGVAPSNIGVISPYRAQLGAIRRAFGTSCNDVEVDTVDRYQGRDKECIILSLVKASPSGGAGGLLQDWRRVNVAITRAKTKLILIGCATALRQTHIFSELIHVIDSLHGVVELPHQAHGPDDVCVDAAQPSDTAA